jgi:hypothetical protein
VIPSLTCRTMCPPPSPIVVQAMWDEEALRPQ